MKKMYKKICFIVLVLILIQSLNTFSQSIERKVIASGGINYQSATLNVSSTIGETFITTIGNSGLLLTQGFQQPVPYNCTFVLNNGQDTIAACGTSYTLDAGSGYSSYNWSNSSTTQTSSITTTGWYTCTVTQGLCTSSDSVFVSLVDGQILNNDTVICLGQSVALSLTGDNGVWKHIGNLPSGVCAAAGYIDNGKIWIHGGGNPTSLISQGMYFDLNTGTTGYASTIPFVRAEPGFGRVGNKFYVIGGYTGSVASNNTQEYDLTSGVWSQKSSMPTNRSVLSSAVLNNEIYVFGGWPGTKNTFEKFNPVLNSWTSLTPIPTARHSVNSATALNGKLYFLSGKNDVMTEFYNSNEVFDPISNTWQSKAPVLYSVYGASATTLNNKIYLVGGSRGSYNQYVNNTMEIFKYTQIYNPVSDSWSLGPELPYGTSLAQLLVDGGNLYLIGGLSKDSSNNVNVVSSIYKLNTSLSYLWSNGATTATVSVTPTQTTTYYCTVSNGISSCTDSVTITVNPTSTSSSTATACDSYQWNGNTYTSSGTYTYTTTNTVGCDSVATLNLTITPSTINTTSITSCGSYTWIVNGQTYSQSGAFSSQSSCHTEILNLALLPVPSMPVLACYQTATFNNTTCSWDITGSQPAQPTLACYETAIFNNTTCSWDITGSQPEQPTLACYETATFNNTTCVWDVTGTQPAQPTLACWTNAAFNNTTCTWDITGNQPAQPTLACYETASFNTTTCSWETTGSQPTQPALACYESANFNTTSCSWDVTGVQPSQPTLACYESANFNTGTCSWDVTGTQPAQPTLACYESASFNTTTCSWETTGSQPTQPTLACYESTNFNTSTCAWDITGVQPTQPTLACYETANFNTTTCTWDVTGSPAAPIITTDSGCDTYTWTANGQVYTQSGTYTYSANCQDYTLNLTVTNSTVYYQDQDFDGYGSNTNTLNSCNGAPVGYIAVAGDCNDNNANINPGASEICGNGIDDNCDGNMDEGCGCINPPTAFAGLDTSICAGNNISLNGSIGGGASNAVWTSNGSGTFTPSANVLNANYIPSSADIIAGTVLLTLTTNANAPCVAASSSLQVSIHALPEAPGAIAGPADICYPLNNIFTYSINPVAGASSYTWTFPAGAVIQGSATGTSVQVKFINANVHLSIVGPITVIANNSNGCVSAPSSLELQVQITAPIQPSSISGPASACSGDIGVYSILPVFRAMSYNWTLPTGAAIIAGAGTNIITVQYDGSFTGGVISVTASNICGTGAARTRTVTQNILTAPQAINGPVDGLCNASNVTYSIVPVNGATSYNWILPLGATITSGYGSNAITVDFSNTFTGGNISVAAVNACGVGLARSITVKAVPGIPTAINGPTTSCVSSNQSYSTPPVVGTLTYSWTVPGGAIITNGQGTKNIDMTYGSIASSTGIITVKSANSCGASNVRVLAVKTTNCPRIDGGFGAIITIHPNPTSGILNIESNELIKRIELFDMLGKLVMTYGNEKQIDISNLQSGLYLIRFTSENGVEQRRVEVSR